LYYCYLQITRRKEILLIGMNLVPFHPVYETAKNIKTGNQPGHLVAG